MRKRFTLAAGCLGVLLTGYYIVSPLLAAHNLRMAVKNGDTKTIDRMIDWPSLRASLRRTIAQNARLLPLARQAARRASTSWWQRIRSAFGHSMLDRFVERYINPRGLPELYRAKSNWHARARPGLQPISQAGIIPTSLQSSWRRVKRAEFINPFRFILEVEDRHKATRLIKSTFQLTEIGFSGLRWKLTEIAIRTAKPAKAHLSRLYGF
jgi:Protein of unknown function (DUF2939)